MIFLKISGPLVSFGCAVRENATLSDLEDLIVTISGHYESESLFKEGHLYQFSLKVKLDEDSLSKKYTKLVENNKINQKDISLEEFKLFYKYEKKLFSSHEHVLDDDKDKNIKNSENVKISEIFEQIVSPKSFVFEYDFGANYEYQIKIDKVANKYSNNIKKLESTPLMIVYNLKGEYCNDFYALEDGEEADDECEESFIEDFTEKTKNKICEMLSDLNPKFKNDIDYLFLNGTSSKPLNFKK